jgi:hypothetical protein
VSNAAIVRSSREPAAICPTGPGIASDANVLPERVTTEHADRGPRFGDDVWDIRAFLPRTAYRGRIDFTTLADPIAVTTAKEYLYSRMRRAVPTSRLSGSSTRPLKITGLVGEFNQLRVILESLAVAGAHRLSHVTAHHLNTVLTTWKDHPVWAAQLVRVLKGIAGHGPFLTNDRLAIAPGRAAPARPWSAPSAPRKTAPTASPNTSPAR